MELALVQAAVVISAALAANPSSVPICECNGTDDVDDHSEATDGNSGDIESEVGSAPPQSLSPRQMERQLQLRAMVEEAALDGSMDVAAAPPSE